MIEGIRIRGQIVMGKNAGVGCLLRSLDGRNGERTEIHCPPAETGWDIQKLVSIRTHGHRIHDSGHAP